MCVNWKINNIAKEVNFVYNGDREMKFESLDDGVDDTHNDVHLVEISKIIATQEDFFCEEMLFARVSYIAQP